MREASQRHKSWHANAVVLRSNATETLDKIQFKRAFGYHHAVKKMFIVGLVNPGQARLFFNKSPAGHIQSAPHVLA